MTNSLPQLDRELVLLVEDDDRVRSLVAITLNKLGYRVLDAADGGEALSLSESHQGEIALLLIDLVLPSVDGRDLARSLKESQPQAKVILATGQSADVLEEIVEREEGLQVLGKPFDREELAATIRLALNGPGGRA